MNQSWRRFRPKTQLLPKSWRDRINFGYRYIIAFIILIVISILVFLGYRYYLNHTTIVAASGGTLIEGMAGQPKLINPILSQTNDVDRDIVKLVFSSLLTFDHNHNLVGQLAEKWDISEDQKSYTVFLRHDVQWHDGQNFTADDVVYTFQLIQNPQYPGTLADNWRDVTVEKIDDYTVKFTLPDVFSPFLVNLTTGILPYHILKDVAPGKIDQIDFNLRPIGTGPYKIDTIKYDRAQNKYNSIELAAFDNYFDQKPNISYITVKFYSTYQELYQAYNAREINSISRILTADWPMISNTVSNLQFYDIALPQYTAIFINQDGKALLRDPYVKEAMTYSLNREEILQNILSGKGKVVDTPILDGFLGHNPDILHIYQDEDKARSLLEAGKWSDVDGDGIREKDGVRLTVRLVTSDNPDFVLAANLIQKYWKEVGFDVQFASYNIGDLENNFIETRNYDCLLFGENLGQDPDPYPYWHSTQIENPGLNLSQYTNIEVDKYLEEGRHSNDTDIRIHSYLPFQEVIFDDKPAIFLTQPYYIYAVNQSVQGVDVEHASNPADRFQFISEWYINTKRVWQN
ncbi:MAG TPA: ABC transporter substrate-binding protein [bacterium]|nr:ABC transporter substrate-binding protein [bacterium]HPN67462.1 ABC transporter substrate-binding protein [bacterium]